jgi:serine phosphatase RsbU (regulator of sigma subunit)
VEAVESGTIFLKFRDPFCEMTEALSDVPLTALGLSDSLEPEILEYKVQAEDELYISTDGLGCLQAGNVDVKTLTNQSFRDNASLLALKLKL